MAIFNSYVNLLESKCPPTIPLIIDLKKALVEQQSELPEKLEKEEEERDSLQNFFHTMGFIFFYWDWMEFRITIRIFINYHRMIDIMGFIRISI